MYLCFYIIVSCCKKVVRTVPGLKKRTIDMLKYQ